jgi:hypothetical protein
VCGVCDSEFDSGGVGGGVNGTGLNRCSRVEVGWSGIKKAFVEKALWERVDLQYVGSVAYGMDGWRSSRPFVGRVYKCMIRYSIVLIVQEDHIPCADNVVK